MAEVVYWYVLGDDQQQLGPYTSYELQQHFLSGYFLENTLVWSEGRSEWNPLSSVPELMSPIAQKGSDFSAAEATNRIGVADVPTGDDEDEFEKWQREVSEAEAEAEAEKLKNGYAASTVETDNDAVVEQEFTDYDGTTYKWDRSLRVWVPQEDVTSVDDQYRPEDMTFSKEDEVFPILNAADEILESKNNGKRKLEETQTEEKDKPVDKKVFLCLCGRYDAKISIPSTVILRYMFAPAEMRADENLCSELEEDVKEECSVDSFHPCNYVPCFQSR
ncbi:hypothetical protein LINPERHAP1_LOCUS10646 [Linum perenne]